MIISNIDIQDAKLIQFNVFKDERGSFFRQFCRKELLDSGIDFDIKQCNISTNNKKNTLRGMHYQKDPYPEKKIVTCLNGRIYDVLVDLRPYSRTYLRWSSIELSKDANNALYIPAGIAHGYQTLTDDTVIQYQLDAFFHPESYTGVLWNDPKINIVWPECNSRIINDRDNNYPLL